MKALAIARSIFSSRPAQIAAVVIALSSALYGLHRRAVNTEVGRIRAVAAVDSARAVAAAKDSAAAADSARWAVELTARDSVVRVARKAATKAQTRWASLRDSLATVEATTGLPEGVGNIVAAADTTIKACRYEADACATARQTADSARAVAEEDRDRLKAERDSALTIAREHATARPPEQPFYRRKSFWTGVGAGAVTILTAGILGGR